MLTWSNPDIRFDPETHTYWLGHIRLPSVTEVIATVLGKPRTGSGRYRWNLRRGELVHQGCLAAEAGTWDPVNTSPAVAGPINAWVRFLNDFKFETQLAEQPVYHVDYLIAGTLDRLGETPEGLTLVEMKTGNVAPSIEAELQCGCYALCLESLGVRVNRLAVVWLRNDGQPVVNLAQGATADRWLKSAKTIMEVYNATARKDPQEGDQDLQCPA